MVENTKISIGNKGKVRLNWYVSPVDYSRDKENNLITQFANKYNIPKDNIKIEPKFTTTNKDGKKVAVTNEIVQNIQEPRFQQKLFKEYISDNGLTEKCDFETILNIDNQLNTLIDYSAYDKHKIYKIKWVKWSNFMSYGEDNFFDFTKLKGLVLLNGAPQNQSGKSTFCNDLIRFLLFGKISSRVNDWTLSEVFNYYKPEATEVIVEGCLEIDGDEYIIKRVVSRPELKRRTEKSKVSQKVSYYKIVNGEYYELENYDNQQGESTTKTNLIIKEAIGSEKDFDMVICANADNLKALISLKDTERGRLLSRWVGLLPLEEKDKLAREKFNKEINPSLTLNKFNKETLKLENEELEKNNEIHDKSLKETTKLKDESIIKIEEFEQTKETLLSSKKQIDSTLLNVDVKTLETRMSNIEEKGKLKKLQKEENEKKYLEVKNVTFSEDDYKSLIKKDKTLSLNLNDIKNECNNLKKEIKTLQESEYCPTCGAKLVNVDNSQIIEEKKKLLESKIENGIGIKKVLDDNKLEIEKKEIDRERYNLKNRLELLIDTNEVDIKNLRNEYMDVKRTLDSLIENKNAIENNNKIDLSLNIVNTNIKAETQYKDGLLIKIENLKNEINNNNKIINYNKELISTIEREEKLLQNWKIYLDMVGKNGITKMVLRNALPLINGELKRLLSDVCDFDVEVMIDNHNDISFNLIRGGVISPLSSGSGFEQTVAGLSLRIVLGNISILPRPNYILLDEILGGIAQERYDNIKMLYDRILKDYSFVFQITHLKEITDWHDTIINVEKINNVSHIKNK